MLFKRIPLFCLALILTFSCLSVHAGGDEDEVERARAHRLCRIATALMAAQVAVTGITLTHTAVRDGLIQLPEIPRFSLANFLYPDMNCSETPIELTPLSVALAENNRELIATNLAMLFRNQAWQNQCNSTGDVTDEQIAEVLDVMEAEEDSDEDLPELLPDNGDNEG